jgi:A/G-specific adenine glycosylase
MVGNENHIGDETAVSFRAVVLGHYREHGRDLPWRKTYDPYEILVSEVMLQQTQVARVITKYSSFLSLFPELGVLAAAPLRTVLAAWQGLGYNRRALALHRTAQTICSEHHGRFPRSAAELQRLPGIGPATAAAVCVFAYGLPLVFIETNIRSAFLHYFFRDCSEVPDTDILPLVEITLDRDNPRDWYYALMDYGSWVKRTQPNPSRRSKHHTTQTPFEGSHRQIRAQVLRVLLRPTTGDPSPADAGSGKGGGLDLARITGLLPDLDLEEVENVLAELVDEGFLVLSGGSYRIA